MSNVTDKPITGDASFVLLYLKLANFSDAMASLAPQDVIRLVKNITDICRSFADRTDGTLIGLQGDCIMAWNENELSSESISFCDLAHQLVAEIRSTTGALVVESGFSIRFTVSLARGSCIFEQKSGKYTRIVGEPMNRVSRLLDSAEDFAVIIDDSMAKME